MFDTVAKNDTYGCHYFDGLGGTNNHKRMADGASKSGRCVNSDAHDFLKGGRQYDKWTTSICLTGAKAELTARTASQC